MFEVYSYKKEIPEDYFDMLFDDGTRIRKPEKMPIFKIFERNIDNRIVFKAGVHVATHSGSLIPDSTYAEFGFNTYTIGEYNSYKIKIDKDINGITVKMYNDITIDAVIKGLKFILQALEDGIEGNNE